MNVTGEIELLSSEMLDRFVQEPYEDHVARLAPPPRLNPEYVSSSCYFCVLYLSLHLFHRD